LGDPPLGRKLKGFETEIAFQPCHRPLFDGAVIIEVGAFSGEGPKVIGASEE
jgi:hypothetical protein